MKLEDHRDIALELLRRMRLIRATEEAIADRYTEWKMRCPVHLAIGQEAVAAAAGLVLKPSDTAVSTHRSHAHYLGKGGDPGAMIAELYGKAGGCSSARGGSMHLCAPAAGFLASTAIVANSVPIGVGAALSAKLLNTGTVSVVFIGDAVIETGVFHESAAFAVLKKLPVLFLCENNLYSVYTHLRDRQPAERTICQLAGAHGMPAQSGDGNRPWAVYARISESTDFVRAGNGPAFLEFETYRWREHCGPFFDNDLGYRTQSEFESWQARDPVACFEKELREKGMLNKKQDERMNQEVTDQVQAAFQFAEESPFPAPREAFTHLFAGLEGD